MERPWLVSGKCGRNSSVVSSAPSILRPRIRIPSTPSMLYPIYIIVIWIESNCEKDEKSPGLAHFLKKKSFSFSLFLTLFQKHTQHTHTWFYNLLTFKIVLINHDSIFSPHLPILKSRLKNWSHWDSTSQTYVQSQVWNHSASYTGIQLLLPCWVW